MGVLLTSGHQTSTSVDESGILPALHVLTTSTSEWVYLLDENSTPFKDVAVDSISLTNRVALRRQWLFQNVSPVQLAIPE